MVEIDGVVAAEQVLERGEQVVAKSTKWYNIAKYYDEENILWTSTL